MDAERLNKSIEGLKQEKKLLNTQLKFSRADAKILLEELLQDVKEAEVTDPWTDKALAQKAENKFKRSTCNLS